VFSGTWCIKENILVGHVDEEMLCKIKGISQGLAARIYDECRSKEMQEW